MLSYSNALIRESDAFLAALRDGEQTRFDEQHMRIVAEFDTGDPRHSWLTSSLFIGQGRLSGKRRIEYEIHRLD